MILPAAIAALSSLVRNAPKTPIPTKGNKLVPDPSAWPPRDRALQALLANDLDLQEQIDALLPVVNPARRLYLTKSPTDIYGGNLNNAITAALALNPSAADPVVIEILSPGSYAGNFTLVPGLFLVSLSNAPAQAVILTSASGVTLAIPEGNSGIQGVNVITTSIDTADAAVEVVSGGSADNSTFLMQTDIQAPNGSTALRTAPGTTGLLPMIIAGVNGASNSPIVSLQGAGVIAIFGFMINDGSGTVIQVTSGSFAVILNAIVSGGFGGAGWLFDVDGSQLALLGPTRFFSASNLVRGRNGAFLFLFDLTGFSDPSGSVLDLDGVSFAQVGSNFIGTPGSTSAYTGWVGTTTANTSFVPTLGWATGTTAAPDQRPPAPQPGMRFFATDLAPGAEQLTFVPGTGWVNQLGAIVP